MNALILVDIQNDFVAGGALAVPAGEQVVPVANLLMDRFDHVVATQDWHPPDHGSFASQHPGHSIGDVIQLAGLEQVLWPDHCVQDTPGAAFVADLNPDGIDHVFVKGTDPSVDSYSGFFDNARRRATGLADHLQARGVTAVYIIGLATDYCVKFTALDACDLGFATTLIRDGVRSVDLTPGDGEAAIAEMQAAGVTVVNSDQCPPAGGSA